MPSTARRIVLIVAVMSAAGAIAGTWGMVARVTSFNRSSTKELYVFQPVNDRKFTYAGREVVIEDSADEHGNAGVLIRYGDASLPLRATVPPGEAALPGLVRHADWLTVLRFAPRRGISFDELERRIADGEITDRLVAIVREPQPGADPGTFGRAIESDWMFHIREFLPSGEFSTEHLRYPESERSLARRRSAARSAGRPVPERRPDELKEGTWEFAAALLAMPEGSAPGPTFAGDAMGATGWTLPVTGLSFMGLVVAGIGLVVTRERATRERAVRSPETQEQREPA